MGLLVTLLAVFVAGLAAVLGIWMERDKQKPPRYAWALSALIVLATLVSLMQSYIDQQDQERLKEDMARLLATMDKIATESDDPALAELLKSELTAQSRSNPEVIDKVAQRVSDEGRDPTEVLGKHLDAADMEKVSRKGNIKPRSSEKVAEKPKAKADADDTKQAAAAAPTPPAAPRPVAVVPTAPGTPPRPGAIDPAMAARMNAAAAAQAGAQPGAPGTPTAVVATPGTTPTPTPAPVAAPAPTETKTATTKRKATKGKRTAPVPTSPRSPTPRG